MPGLHKGPEYYPRQWVDMVQLRPTQYKMLLLNPTNESWSVFNSTLSGWNEIPTNCRWWDLYLSTMTL